MSKTTNEMGLNTQEIDYTYYVQRAREMRAEAVRNFFRRNKKVEASSTVKASAEQGSLSAA